MHPTTRRLTEPMIVTCRCGRDVVMRAVVQPDGIHRMGRCLPCGQEYMMPIAQTVTTWHERIGWWAGTN